MAVADEVADEVAALAVLAPLLGVPGPALAARLPATTAAAVTAAMARAAAAPSATRAAAMASVVTARRGPWAPAQVALHPAQLTALLDHAPADVRRAWQGDPALAPDVRVWGLRWLVARTPAIARLAPVRHLEVRRPGDLLTWSPARLAGALTELGTALALVATGGDARATARLGAAQRLAPLASSTALRAALGSARPLLVLVGRWPPVDDEAARRLGIAAVAPHVDAVALALRAAPADGPAWQVDATTPALAWDGLAAVLRALATVAGVSSGA